jgi:hypothetical protein
VPATVLPRRAFATTQEVELFLNQARQYWMHERGMLLFPPLHQPAIDATIDRGGAVVYALCVTPV